MFDNFADLLPAPLQRVFGLTPGGVFSTSVSHPCCIVTRLSLTERDLHIDGVVLEISSEGALFREACTYILDRTGEIASLMVDGTLHKGVIQDVSPRGFLFVFDERLDDRQVQDCALRHGLDPVIVL